MKKLGNIRAVAVLLTSVLVAALGLAFVVVQTRAATLQAPTSTERRVYDDGVYTVRLGDTVGAEPGGFIARLTGRQAAKLVTTPGVVSVARLPGRAAVVPLLPNCHSATVPSPSPLPAPIPPADGGVTSPGG
ncbi:hypothetical protein ACFS5L_07470 [Streptomyces phyllanthi]|uniref:Uncharacterized protein n=1 Tax=Streptomyces phyllanthi TaxID=1803180 RepID=A0A5N8VTR9_9ACTN|nr:hypothetical protein [Streptomyces phyllanthi]MPY38641.1 hypothetical protein [Streptomyces phyllanthi]